MKQVSVLVGAGSIGQAIIRRVSAGKHIVLADYSEEYETTRWGKRGATINSISPGIIITPLANDELHGPRKEGYLKMIEGMPARRAGTPDEVGDLAEFLMSSRGRFISGADLLIDGGCTASYWYGDLQYLKTTH